MQTKMNKKLRVILLAVIALITVLLVTSCDGSPYADYDKAGYEVSVKYDANGGTFTAGTSVIVDTYSLNSLYIFEMSVNGSKTNVCNVVKFFQSLHYHITDLFARYFLFECVMYAFFNVGNKFFYIVH